MFTWCSDEAKKKNILVVWEVEPGFIINKPHEIKKCWRRLTGIILKFCLIPAMPICAQW